MANRDNPSGFTPIGTLNGGNYSPRRYKLSGSSGAIGIGDALAQGANGVAVITATGDRVAAVSLEQSAANATGDILAVPVPGVMFRVQADGNTIEEDIGQLADIVVTTLNTTTGRSNHELDTSVQSTATQVLRIIDKDDRPVDDNDWGTWVDLLVTFQENEYVNTAAGTPGV